MSGTSWTPEQDAMLWDQAGLVSPTELTRLVTEHGPAHSLRAVRERARTLDIPLQKRRRRVFRRHSWSAEEDVLLRDLAGRELLDEITRRLNGRFRTRRRPCGVQSRISALGLSTIVPELLTARDIFRILCVTPSEVSKLLRAGEIASVCQAVRAGGVWQVRPEALEAYMREHPERLNLSLMTASRWRDLARSILRRSPHLGADEAADYLVISHSQMSRLLVKGRVPGAVKYSRTWRIPLPGVLALGEALAREAAVVPTEVRCVGALTRGWRTAERIGSELGIDVMLVRAALLRAQRHGIPVEGRPGVGYRLVAALERAS
jgi:biotin operon repressor